MIPASRRRAWLSVVLLTVVPLIYFVLILWFLSTRTWATPPWNVIGCGKNFVSILPALAPFGFYRIWIAVVEWRRELYYGPLQEREHCEQDNRSEMWKQIGIELKVESDLNPRWASGNFFWGAAYVLFGPLAIFIVWCLSRCS